MRLRVLLGPCLIALALGASGCASGRSGKTAAPLAAAPAAEADQQTRAQKPDPGIKLASATEPAPEPSVVGPRASPAVRIRAVVGTEVIFDDEVVYVRNSLLRGHGNFTERDVRDAEKQALETLIDREVVLQEVDSMFGKGPGQKFLEKLRAEANKEFDQRYVHRIMKDNHLKTEEELKEVLSQQHISLELMRRDHQRNFLVQQYLISKVEPHINSVSRREIQEFYDTHPEMFQVPDSVRWQVLFILAESYASREAAQRTAEMVAQRARNGEDFVSLVNQFDFGLNKGSKGEGPGHKRGEIVPPVLEKDLFAMSNGEVRVVPAETGFHVLRLVKRERAGLLPFDAKVQKRIKDKLQEEAFKREKEKLIKTLRAKIVHRILDEK